MHVVLARYCYRESSVRPSVCPSVTLTCPVHIGWTSSKLITRVISVGSSLLRATTSTTFLKFGWNRGVVVLSRKPAVSLKRGKIGLGPRLLLMTNGKSHTRFRLVPKSATLDYLEGPLRSLNEVRLHYQRRRCSSMTLDSGNIRFMRLLGVVVKIYVNFL